MVPQGASALSVSEPADVTMADADASAEVPTSENRSTVSMEPDERSDESDSDELDDWEWIRQHDIFSTALRMPHRDSARPDEWRARREALARKLSEWEASPEGVATNAEVDALLARSSQALGLSSSVGELEFVERATLMFKVENHGPVASGPRPAANIVTKEMIHFAWKAIKACAKQRGLELSRAYGNWDKLVGFGWLLGDVVCGRLIDGGVAYRIGRKHGKRAPELQSAFDAPLRRMGKRTFRDDAARQLAQSVAAQEEADLRREPVEVDFELEPPPAAAAAPAGAASSSEMPPPPPRAPPRPPPAPPPRNPERLERLKLLRAAETLVSNAEGALAAATRARDQAKSAWDYALEQSRNPHRSAQIPEDRWAAWDKQEKAALETARARYVTAERAIGGPEQDLVWAKLEAKEARIELEEYEKELRRQSRMQAREAEEAEKWEQIKEGIDYNNAMYAPGDPEHWEPDAWEYAQLHRMWKLQ